jgi:hypothetical protein
MTTTMTTTETIPMSERRPLKIAKADWPSIAYGEDYAGQFDFQSFDGVAIRVRRHADGRAVVYGRAGDWRGGGRPEREDRSAGFLVQADAGEDAVVRAIRRVAGILADTAYIGEMAHAAARRCIADLPAVDADESVPERTVSMPLDCARRLLATIDRIRADVGNADELADELRVVVEKAEAEGCSHDRA